MRDLRISIAQTQADFFELIRLREEVFVVEQGVPVEIELDDDDARAIHAVGFYEMARFQIDGAPFEEAGILHRRMARFVPRRSAANSRR